ncbi:MAG: hypothetical protein WCF18_12520 [Chthoniobacteraceae bacterium]
MTDSSRNHRLLLALALLVLVVALWWFGSVHGPAAPILPEGKPTPANATPAAAGRGAVPPAAERTKVSLSAEAWHEPERRSGVDASNIYKNAFVLFNALTDAEKKMIRNPKDEVDADAAAALFEKIQPILAMLRDAMKADYCDWGVAPITFATPLNYIGQAQDLGKLALWSAAYRLGTDPANAIEDLQTRARLGHHLSDVLIGGLVSASFEATATNLLRDRLSTFDAATRAAAADFLAASTLDGDFSRGFASEAAMVQGMTDDLLKKSREERTQLIGNLYSDANPAERLPKQKEALALLDSPERLAAEVAFIRATEETMAASLTLPEAEFQAWWKATQAEIELGHPLAQLIIPTIAAIQARVQQRRVERTLFTAGLEVLQNGPAQLIRYRDPATGGALTYVPTPTGFELRSPFGVKGKPVTMSFSKRE